MSVLPAPVRARAVGLAADTLGELRANEVPSPLRAIARFVPAKRAQRGASVIATTLENDPAFRARVLRKAEEDLPGLAESVSAGELPPAADPVDLAVMAFLMQADGWQDMAREAAQEAEQRLEEQELGREAANAAGLREQVSALRAELRSSQQRNRQRTERLTAENTRLRATVHQLRESAAADTSADVTALRTEVERLQDQHRADAAELRRTRARLAEVERDREATRRQERAGRALHDARLSLLVDTLVTAASGLRRELALPVSSLRPADTVSAATATPTRSADLRRSRIAADPAVALEVLRLPGAHLVVDGYNVTKTAWPDSPLDAARTRLVQALGALGSRTGAEITCVFDGAAVATGTSAPAARGVRVLFSPADQIADDVIRDIVRAEPEGRAVVVASSDQDLVNDLRGPGVAPVSASVLVSILSG
ncbi:MAG TPA: NYN domain-containing protein [Jiangellaceae bacterium]|nr:NYN domain-containing protein [Jiangellaceae bacterium]